MQSASLLPPQPRPQRRACRAFDDPNAAPKGVALGALCGLPAVTLLVGSLVSLLKLVAHTQGWWYRITVLSTQQKPSP